MLLGFLGKSFFFFSLLLWLPLPPGGHRVDGLRRGGGGGLLPALLQVLLGSLPVHADLHVRK